MTENTGLKLVDLDEGGVDRAFRADVLAGMREDQKAIPARWLYDDAGSQLEAGRRQRDRCAVRG